MRIAIFAVGCLVLGVLIGNTLAKREFAHEALALPGGTATGGESADAVGPRVSLLTPDRFEFGYMDQNSKSHHTFKIENDGDQPLTLRKAGTSCKCTTAGLVKEQLAPQETAEITLEWEAKGADELFEQYADFETNDVRRPKFRLTVSGQVRAALRAEPREAIFNRVSALEPAQATVRIYGLGAEPLEVLSHEFAHAKSAPHFSLEFKPLGAAELAKSSDYKSGVEMRVHLKPGLPLGQLVQTIQLTTNRNQGGKLDIPVYGTVVSDISLVGPGTLADKLLVDLGSVKSSQGAKSTVYLVVKGPSRDETELKIASVTPDAELTATLGEPLRNNPQLISYPLTLQVSPGTTPVSRLSSGSRIAVRVETTHPQIKEVTFHVRYAVVE
jgi:Protein of unknown function (DUF1573)